MVAHACNPNYLGVGDRRITRLGKVSETLPQIKNKKQRTEGLAQVVEHLFSQFEGWDQSPVPHNQLIYTGAITIDLCVY
jgi:hypothetical protein